MGLHLEPGGFTHWFDRSPSSANTHDLQCGAGLESHSPFILCLHAAWEYFRAAARRTTQRWSFPETCSQMVWWFSQALRSRCPYASLPPLAGWLWALTDGSHQLDRYVHLPCSREAMKAVATLLEHSSTAWLIWNLPSGIQPRTTAATAARNPTTVACTWVTKEAIWKKKKRCMEIYLDFFELFWGVGGSIPALTPGFQWWDSISRWENPSFQH